MIHDTPNCLRASICPSKLSTFLHQVEAQSVGGRRESPEFRETLIKCCADTPVRVIASIVQTFRHKQVLFRLSLGIGPDEVGVPHVFALFAAGGLPLIPTCCPQVYRKSFLFSVGSNIRICMYFHRCTYNVPRGTIPACSAGRERTPTKQKAPLLRAGLGRARSPVPTRFKLAASSQKLAAALSTYLPCRRRGRRGPERSSSLPAAPRSELRW
jgi:hypothetical protein